MHRKSLWLVLCSSKILRCVLVPRCRDLELLSALTSRKIYCRPNREVWYLWISSAGDNVDFVGTSTNSNPPEDILNTHSKSPFTNGIDDRVAQKTGHEDTSGDQDYFGWHFETCDELTAKSCDPARDTAKQERCNNDAYIHSRLPFSYSSWYLLSGMIFGCCGVFHLDRRHVVSLKSFHCFENPPI